MSTIITASYQGTPSLGAGIFLQIRNPADGTVLLARTNGGIREDVAGSGHYVSQRTMTTDLDAYETIWDENGIYYSGEVIVPQPSVTVNVTGGSPLPLIGDANGALTAKTFLIKRNDTLPYLRRQLQDTSGNAIVLDPADTVKFTMRLGNDVLMTAPAKTHASAVIIDAPTGIVEYRWVPADTDTSTFQASGQEILYAGEFEVTRISDGKIESYPQDGYIAISMPRDLDPGVNP